MNKFYYKNHLGFVIAVFSSTLSSIISSPAHANPAKNCVPVARSVETNKSYCAHELDVLKTRDRDVSKDGGVFCYIAKKIIPFSSLLNLDQCLPKEAARQFNSKGERITPKIKGSKTTLTLLKPLGNVQATSQPEFAWQPISNATYRVSLEQSGQWVWSQKTERTSAKLPADHSLKLGSTYKLSVVAFKNDQMVAEQTKYLTLVDPQKIREIDTAISQAQRSSPNTLVSGLDRASMLYHLGIFDAAITQLESLFQFKDPSVYSLLGLIYQEAGQTKIAQDYLDKASELADRKSKPLSRFN